MLNLPDWLLSPWRTLRRRRLLAQPFPAEWLQTLERLPFYRQLPPACQERLRRDLRIVIAERQWEGCNGVVVTDEMRVVIAATACLLLLGLEHDHYANVSSILIYPSSWHRAGGIDATGESAPDRRVLGEAWRHGPVVLAWDASRHGSFRADDGRNLVLHEFAHKLDLVDGYADGRPPLRARGDAAPWRTTMQREFEALTKAADRGTRTLLDHYGATDPAEFFAVATECFFERGPALEQRHPSLYAELRRFYGQDPARRAADAARG
jgi:Mlc titration factor MtfA (ptsG expression regulator)